MGGGIGLKIVVNNIRWDGWWGLMERERMNGLLKKMSS
jgi:hypothetical protein